MRPKKGHSEGQRSSYIRWRLKGIILFTERKAYSLQVTLEGSTITMLQSQPFAPEQQIPTQLICDLPRQITDRCAPLILALKIVIHIREVFL